jgi:hypothetical protein
MELAVFLGLHRSSTQSPRRYNSITCKEDRMKNLARIIIVLIPFVMISTAGCGGSNTEGTYTSNMGNVVLDLKSGGKATFTLMGESMPCKYNVKSEKLVLDCTPKGEKVDFVIHGDGSLSGPGFIGSMKKSA